MIYLGRTYLIRTAIRQLQESSQELKSTDNLLIMELSSFKKLTELVIIAENVYKHNPHASVLLIQGKVNPLPHLESVTVSLQDPLSVWKEKIKQANKCEKNKVKNIILACKNILSLTKFSVKEREVIRLIAKGLNIEKTSEMAQISPTRIYRTLFNIRHKLKFTSIHRVMLYIINEFGHNKE